MTRTAKYLGALLLIATPTTAFADSDVQSPCLVPFAPPLDHTVWTKTVTSRPAAGLPTSLTVLREVSFREDGDTMVIESRVDSIAFEGPEILLPLMTPAFEMLKDQPVTIRLYADGRALPDDGNAMWAKLIANLEVIEEANSNPGTAALFTRLHAMDSDQRDALFLGEIDNLLSHANTHHDACRVSDPETLFFETVEDDDISHIETESFVDRDTGLTRSVREVETVEDEIGPRTNRMTFEIAPDVSPSSGNSR